MELVIAGSIALLGYVSAAPGRGSRDDDGPRYARQLGPSNQYDTEEGEENDTGPMDRDHVRRAQARWQEARDPARTGVVVPGAKLTTPRLPFFKSAKAQSDAPGMYQYRMERFTGASGSSGDVLAGTYRNKREVEALFPPSHGAERLTFSGTAGNQQADSDRTRYAPSRVHNNVLPAEQIRVGPGVGVGPDVTASSDGFHPMYRVMPKNVGDYKRNNLAGGVITGGSAVAKRPTRSAKAVGVGRRARVVTSEDRPPERGMAAVTAPTRRAELPRDPADRRTVVVQPDRLGNPFFAGPEVRAGMETREGYDCGDNPDRNKRLPTLNATGTAAGGAATGGFTYAGYDPHQFQTQHREMRGREGFVAGPTARRVPAGYLVPATQRSLTEGPAPVGAPTLGVPGGVGPSRPDRTAKKTLRETQQGPPPLTGTMSAVRAPPLQEVWRPKRLGRESKRGEGMAVMDRTGGPQRVNVVDPKGAGAVAQRPRDVEFAQAAIPHVQNKEYNGVLGMHTVASNKLASANPRLDLGMVAEQLRDNPYATMMWDVAGNEGL